MSFQVTNYHSKKALSKAVSAGKKIKLIPISLTKEQLKQNADAALSNTEPPHILPTTMPYHQYEIQGSSNKQVPIFFCTVILDINCDIMKVE